MAYVRKGGNGGARPGAGRPKGAGSELVDTVRAAFHDAMARSEEAGRPISTLLLRELKRSPTRFLDAMARFLPKDINIRDERSVLDELTDQELAELVRQARASTGTREGAAAPKGKAKLR